MTEVFGWIAAAGALLAALVGDMLKDPVFWGFVCVAFLAYRIERVETAVKDATAQLREMNARLGQR